MKQEERKHYETPALKKLGNLKEITQSQGLPNADDTFNPNSANEIPVS